MVFNGAAALDVGMPRESTTSFSRSGHCRARNSSRISNTLRADFVNPSDMHALPYGAYSICARIERLA